MVASTPVTPAALTTTSTTVVATTTTITETLDTGDIQGFKVTTIRLNGEELSVAVADNDGLRVRGLMGVTSFGDVDGMIFAWNEPGVRSFWMWTVPIPLDVAFFDESGDLTDVLAMAPCVGGAAVDCPRYTPNGSYVYAVERRAGDLINLPRDSTLEVDSSTFFQP